MFTSCGYCDASVEPGADCCRGCGHAFSSEDKFVMEMQRRGKLFGRMVAAFCNGAVDGMSKAKRASPEMDEIVFPAGTPVKIRGLPFWLASDTVLLGNRANLELLHFVGEEPAPEEEAEPVVVALPTSGKIVLTDVHTGEPTIGKIVLTDVHMGEPTIFDAKRLFKIRSCWHLSWGAITIVTVANSAERHRAGYGVSSYVREPAGKVKALVAAALDEERLL